MNAIRFHLQRNEDITGASGTGRVADGVKFDDGTVVIRWIHEYASTVVWSGPNGIDAVERIHGHDGKTVIVWHDDYPLTDAEKFLETYSTKAQRLNRTLSAIEAWAFRLDTCAEWNGSPILPIVAEMREWVQTYGSES